MAIHSPRLSAPGRSLTKTRSAASTRAHFQSRRHAVAGGILVGDASEFGTLLGLFKGGQPLTVTPASLVSAGGRPASGDDQGAQVCSCNNVAEGAIRAAVRVQKLTTVAAVKACTQAGTGCGGCLPRVTELLKAELKAMGARVDNRLCEHFTQSRQELYQIVLIKEIKTFSDLISSHGSGHGCEICKPAVASILTSLWNESVLDKPHATLQDTNDRFLANIQRGGLYSVVPRVPGGEITPEKLIVLGQVARKYGLYTKITGGQRVDHRARRALAAGDLGRADRSRFRKRPCVR